jgi:hypothetical protein
MSDQAPDLMHPVLGFRLWRVEDDALWSPYADHRWGRGRQTARCIAGPRRAHAGPSPGHACTCGIYAPCPRLASAATSDLVGGAVALWGQLELHPTGVRAQHAMVVALALPFSRWAKRQRILAVARALEVEAVPARRLVATASAYGAPVPRELVPRPARDLRDASDRRRADAGWANRRQAAGSRQPAP